MLLDSGGGHSARGAEWPRALVYSHDARGLGHIRLTLPIAVSLAQRQPDLAVLLVTGAARVDLAPLPANLDVVKLPAVGRAEMYTGLPANVPPGTPRLGIWGVRSALLTTLTRVFAPDLVFVDHAPTGVSGELKQALFSLHRTDPRPTFVLGLPDIVNDAGRVANDWGWTDGFRALEEVYERIVVYGDRRVFDPTVEYGFSAEVAAKTVFCGYLPPAVPTTPPDAVRERLGAGDRPLLVMTTGGGEEGAPVLRAFLDALEGGLLGAVAAFVTTGPFLRPDERAAIAARAARVPHVTVVRHAEDLVDVVRAADVVVTLGGYGAVCEALSLGKRPVIVPRAGPEQQIRADRLTRLGLARVVAAADLTPERLAASIRSELAAEASPPRWIEFDALTQVVDELIAHLHRRSPPR